MNQPSTTTHRPDTLAPMDVAGRIPRLLAALDGAGCDALVVSRMVNVRYLTGFTGSSGTVVVSPGGLVFITDGRYGEQAAAQLAAAGVAAQVVVGRTLSEQKESIAGSVAGITRLGLEADAITWAQLRRWQEWFPGPQPELVATSSLVEALRLVKDEGELDRMAQAARIADSALAEVRHLLAEGVSEGEFAIALDFEMRRQGASGPSFDTIVASGPNGAMPHHQPGDRRIGAGELVVVDFGAIFDGYCSDTTRTFCVGEPANPLLARMVEVVAESQAAGLAAVRAGAEAKAVDDACRSLITSAEEGWGEAFLHSTGHGVGLEIHENPRVSSASTDTLVAGNVVTVEPGVYLPGHGGVRIEDTVVVTADGCRILTNASKELIVA